MLSLNQVIKLTESDLVNTTLSFSDVCSAIKLLRFSLIIAGLTAAGNAFSHGGASGGATYKFDQDDGSRDRAIAERKAAEKKKEQDDWADFMKAVNKPKKTTEHEHGVSHSQHD